MDILQTTIFNIHSCFLSLILCLYVHSLHKNKQTSLSCGMSDRQVFSAVNCHGWSFEWVSTDLLISSLSEDWLFPVQTPLHQFLISSWTHKVSLLTCQWRLCIQYFCYFLDFTQTSLHVPLHTLTYLQGKSVRLQPVCLLLQWCPSSAQWGRTPGAECLSDNIKMAD